MRFFVLPDGVGCCRFVLFVVVVVVVVYCVFPCIGCCLRCVAVLFVVWSLLLGISYCCSLLSFVVFFLRCSLFVVRWLLLVVVVDCLWFVVVAWLLLVDYWCRSVFVPVVFF